MTENDTFKKVQKLVETHGQGHVLGFWDELDPADKTGLLAQIEKLDFGQIDRWIADLVKQQPSGGLEDDRISAPESYPVAPVGPQQQAKYAEAAALGERLISQGKVAAFVVAGGQGTRLGFDGPKGDFPISPVKNKTLFQIFAETIVATSRKYGAVCPWYIMTSPANYYQTVRILESNHYYGLGANNVVVFQQGTLPNFDREGKILMADKATIACSPDGHGGSLKAVYDSGALADMKRRGVELLSYWQVDNPLVYLFDPLFIGLHMLDDAEMSSKAVIKTEPLEKVGNFCLIDGRITVIEYSDLSDDLACKRNPDGSLLFHLGSIAIHLIGVDFVARLNDGGFSLPLHRAAKIIPHIDENGRRIDPDEPNGVKLETFVFDALPMAADSIILDIDRAQQFAPTKNRTGKDSAETTRQMMIARAADWLESAGVRVPRKPDGSPDCILEIAPGFALTPDDVKAKVNRIPEIKPGDRVYLA